jgi:hypothetical protein
VIVTLETRHPRGHSRQPRGGNQHAIAAGPTKLIRGPYLQSSMYRRLVIDAFGRFDESFKQGDKCDFVLRVIERQFKLVLDDGTAAYYRRHDGNVTRNVMRAKLKWVARNHR